MGVWIEHNSSRGQQENDILVRRTIVGADDAPCLQVDVQMDVRRTAADRSV